jgi:hypothetical protein
VPLQLHEAPDLGPVDSDVRVEIGRCSSDGGQIDAEQLGASFQRCGDRPGVGRVVRFPSPHERNIRRTYVRIPAGSARRRIDTACGVMAPTGRHPGRRDPAQRLPLSALRPRGEGPAPRGRSPDRSGLAQSSRSPGPMARPGGRRGSGRTRPPTYQRTPTRRPALRTHYQPYAAKAQHEKDRPRVEGYRDGPVPPGDGTTLWPSRSPLVRSAVRLPHGRQTWSAWAIRHVPVNHAYVPKSIPRPAKLH